MRALRGLLSLAAAASVLVCPVNKVCAAADVYPIVSNVTAISQYTDITAASEYLREQTKLKKSMVSINYAVTMDKSDDVLDELFKYAYEETGCPDEGDYLRYGIYGCACQTFDHGKYVTFILRFEYFTTQEQERYVDKRVGEIVQELSLKGKSEYEKIKLIYDYIVRNVDYADDLEDNSVYSAYGALANGKAVCQGITQLFYRLASAAGVSSRIIAGTTGSGDHVWVTASINGTYYLLDPTWDSNFDGVNKYFFLRGTETFDQYSGEQKHITGMEQEKLTALYPDYTSAEFNMYHPVAKSDYSPSDKPVDYMLGDVNFDADIDGTDAAMALRAYAEVMSYGNCSLTGIQRLAADVDRDGSVDGSDASLLLTYYAMKDSGQYKNMDEMVRSIIKRGE